MAVRDWAQLAAGRVVSGLAVGLTVSSMVLLLVMPSRQPRPVLLLSAAITGGAGITLYLFHVWGCIYLWLYPIPAGHCTACGYDLTGNVSGICPECGKPTGAMAQDRDRQTGG
jgi:hypothetical protein